MIEYRDLALNHRWVMGLQRHGAHISVISLTLLGIAHIGVRGHHLSTKIHYKRCKRSLLTRKRIQPYYVIKTLKEWDLLLHHEKIGKEEIVVLNTEDPCGEEEIIVNRYDISSRLFKKKLIAMCGKVNNVKIVNGVLREFIKSSKPIVVYSNKVNDGGKRKITQMNIKVDFYISLFKNSSKLEIEGYESVKTVLNKVFTEINKI
jgi:hypothetical protein